MKPYFLLLFLWMVLFEAEISFGQSAFVQSDRSCYAVGERVSIACRSSVTGEAIAGVIVKWELFGNTEQPSFHFFSQFNGDGWCGFDFNLPYDLNTGSYILRGSTCLDWEQLELYSITLNIVNPSVKWDEQLQTNIQPDVDFERLSEPWISVQASGVETELQLIDIKGLKPLTLAIVETETAYRPNISLSALTQEQWLACGSWSRQMWFYGKTLKHKKPASVNIMGLYYNEADSIKMTKSNNEGIFKISLHPYKGIRHFQPLAFGDFENDIEYQPYTPSLVMSKSTGKADEEVYKYYQLSQVRQSVKTYFSVFDPLLQSDEDQSSKPQLKAQKAYKVANYNKFDLLRDFCRENDSPLKFKEKNQKWKAEILIPGAYAKKFNAVTQNPLIIVNGQLATNDHLISAIKTKDIEEIELYYDLESLRSVYSVFGTEGVVKIKSGGRLDCFDKKELKEIFNLQGLYKREKSRSSIMEEKINNGMKPVFEPCLLFEMAPLMQKVKVVPGDEKTDYRIFGIYMDEREKLYKAESTLHLNN